MKIFYLLKAKYVHIFKVVFFLLGLAFCQSKIMFSSAKYIEIIDSLNSALLKRNSLAGIYKLNQTNFSSDTLIYQYHQESKLIDTIFTFGLDNISDKIKSKLIDNYKTTSIDNNFGKIGKRIKSENYFISKEPKYVLGTTKNSQLVSLLYFETQFHSYFSGNFGLSKDLSDFNFTGEINLHLENIFKSTGFIDIKWERFDSLSQIINLNIFEPYILNSDFGVAWQYYHGLVDGLFSKKESRIKIDFSFYNYSNFELGYLIGENIPTKQGTSNNYNKVKYEGISFYI